MTNVIRQDVVKIGFDVEKNPIAELNKEIEKLKKVVAGMAGVDSFNEMSDAIKDTKQQSDKAKKSLNDVANVKFDKVTSGLKKVGSAIGKVSVKAAKLTAVGIGAAATGAGAIIGQSISSYADYEQLKGGVETLFGTNGAKSVEEYAKLTGKSVDAVQGKFKSLENAQSTVLKNAANAYKTSGLSQNAYMETVTSFSASLISSLKGDTVKAADMADSALVDMADNANKMGTDISMIQSAYTGFAKQNYTMLDNLKLGYGGTKTEMERLVKDAAKLDKSVNANSLSFDNIVKAIHAVQKNMSISGITYKEYTELVESGKMTHEEAFKLLGTTAKEANFTITGSLNQVKAAWGNMLTAIGSGENLDMCFENLMESVEIFGKNVLPVAERAFVGLGTVIEKVTPKIVEKLPSITEQLLPPLLKAATSLVATFIRMLPIIIKSLIAEIPNIVKEVGKAIGDAFGTQFPVIQKIGDFFKNNSATIASSIKMLIPVVIALVAAFKGFKAFNTLKSIFGKSAAVEGAGEGKGGLFSGITNTFKGLANTKPTVILKGMANLAIIIGGFTLIAAALAAVAPHMAKLTDAKSLIEVVGVISVLGLVGTALAKFAGIVGKIPVTTVALGLANMAIMIAGMSALFLLVGAVSLINFDLKRILGISLLIGVLGTIGAALSVFAGIVGLIPVPVVLLGLTNMALVLGGMTALIVAFGKLTEAEGFMNFLQKGGEVLPKICNIIGNMAGSLVGGLAEGITNSLPKIGENIAAFATSLKPMFTMFKGADMSGIGSFFKAMGSFMLQMAAEGVLSFFTGGTNFEELGTKLNTFAESSQGFFKKVATFPENGFTNATKLFNCLAGLKGLPKEGGVMGWFNGGINYTTLADGLSQLASEKVTGFFNTVATLKQAGFDMATKMFECLAGLKSLPKDGGVVGWFMGGIKYDKIAAGLGELATEGVKNFFTMVAGLDQKAFDNTAALFTSLANMGDLPKEGGWWDKLTGSETTTIGNLANELSSFSEKTATFFQQVNDLNLEKLNGLWNSLQNSETVTASVTKVVDDHIDDLVKKITDLPNKMGEGLKSSGEALSTAMVSIWTDAVKATTKPINKLISGANWILKEFGSEKRVADWTPYARGTNGHKGGNALVNDGRGAELVQMPNGRTFIPNGRNVFIPNAPKGMKVLPAERTAQLLGRKSPTFRYANGTGDIDIWSYMDNAKGLISAVSNKYVKYDGMSGFAKHIGKGMVSTVTGQMSKWAEKLFEEFGALSLEAYNPSKGVEQWRSTVMRALKMENQYSAANVARTLYQMQTESGGNPRAINLWDSNAKKGIPSKGLMQVIDPTFRAYARAGFDKNIYDPLSNILASVRYATSRYGSLSKAYRGVGYSKGVGSVTLPERSVSMKYTPENSYTGGKADIKESNTYAPVFNLTINGSTDTRKTERDVKRWVNEAMEEFFDSLERKSPRLREV